MSMTNFGDKIEVLEMRRTRTSYNFFMDFINLENNTEDMAILDATGNTEAQFFRNNQPDFDSVSKFLHNKAVLLSSIKFKENINQEERLALMKKESELVKDLILPIWSTENSQKSYYEYKIVIDNKNQRILLDKIFEEHKPL